MAIEEKSQNKKLQIAIFEYLNNQFDPNVENYEQSDLHKQLLRLVVLYSNPDQLTDLRECCIEYLQKTVKLHRDCLIVYVRMLEDEES